MERLFETKIFSIDVGTETTITRQINLNIQPAYLEAEVYVNDSTTHNPILGHITSDLVGSNPLCPYNGTTGVIHNMDGSTVSGNYNFTFMLYDTELDPTDKYCTIVLKFYV